MPMAARVGDPTSHGGTVGTPPPMAARSVATVWIGGKPAAVVGSLVVCPIPPHAATGPANVITPNPNSLTKGQVLIGGLPAARQFDQSTCGAKIMVGAPNVFIGGVV